MVEQLQQIIQQFGQQAVVENPEVPNEQNDAVIAEAQNSVQNGLQNLAQSGELNALVEQARTGQQVDESHPAVQQISNNLSGNLIEKFGLNSGAAKGIAASIIPAILGKIFGNRGQGGGFDLSDLLSSFTGGNNANTGNTGGFQSKVNDIGSKLGLDKDKDGDVDLNDLKSLF